MALLYCSYLPVESCFTATDQSAAAGWLSWQSGRVAVGLLAVPVKVSFLRMSVSSALDPGPACYSSGGDDAATYKLCCLRKDGSAILYWLPRLQQRVCTSTHKHTTSFCRFRVSAFIWRISKQSLEMALLLELLHAAAGQRPSARGPLACSLPQAASPRLCSLHAGARVRVSVFICAILCAIEMALLYCSYLPVESCFVPLWPHVSLSFGLSLIRYHCMRLVS